MQTGPIFGMPTQIASLLDLPESHVEDKPYALLTLADEKHLLWEKICYYFFI